MEDATALIEAVDENVSRVRTRSLDISFNELFDMYVSEELVIDPAFQRLFRWDHIQRSQFIESLVLELPLPPIFVIEKESGVFELIDGLQRISSYLHFRNELQVSSRRVEDDAEADEESSEVESDEADDQEQLFEDLDALNKQPLRLTGCEILKHLNGLTFDDLPRAIQIKLKRHTIRMEVIRKQSEPGLRYHMFKRLNRGGSLLSDQEVRNATVRLLDSRFPDFLNRLAEEDDFVHCTRYLTKRKKREMYRQELLLRYMAVKNDFASYVHYVDPFLTKYMEKVSQQELPIDYDEEASIFRRATRAIRSSLGAQAFSTVKSGGGSLNNFSVYHFEAAMWGFVEHLDKLDKLNAEQLRSVGTSLMAFKGGVAFRRVTKGGGLNYPGPLKARLQLFSEALAQAIDESA